MRGKLAKGLVDAVIARNIPAYAGKTRRNRATATPQQEHPRVCGENVHGHIQENLGGGTSPRMRGKLAGNRGKCAYLRNIPAYAGKTVLSIPNRVYSWEHPRVCGENSCRRIRYSYHQGTSPRMRGKRKKIQTELTLGRNIPAYAGKTWSSRDSFDSDKEHPRVCGENFIISLIHCENFGTSPRMRGKRQNGRAIRSRFRNIPAYAGKTILNA